MVSIARQASHSENALRGRLKHQSSDEIYASVPLELRRYQQWVLHNATGQEHGREKKPIQIDGTSVSVTNPSTWTGYEQAIAHVDRGVANGIGFVFTDDDPFVGLDLDECVDLETGVISSWAQLIIDRLASYSEVSVSGTGIHILVEGTIPEGSSNRNGKGLEVYQNKRYFTVSGKPITGCEKSIQVRPIELLAVLSDNDMLPKQSKLETPSETQGSSSESHYWSTASIPMSVMKLIDRDGKLQGLWSCEQPLQGQLDKSHSNYGYLLVCQLALQGVSIQYLLNTLVAFRIRHRAQPRQERWFRLEVEKAHAWARDERSKPNLSKNQWLASEVFIHWKKENALKPVDLAIMLSLATSSSDGEYARKSAVAMSANVRTSLEYVIRRIRIIESVGCLEVVERAQRGRPKNYRFAFDHHHN